VVQRRRSAFLRGQRLQCRNALKREIVSMYVFAWRDHRICFPNEAPVPDHLLSHRDFAQSDLVTRGNRPLRPDFTAANNDRLPRRQRYPRDGDIVGRVQLDRRRRRSGSGLNV
jgi:hypothetical protein